MDKVLTIADPRRDSAVRYEWNGVPGQREEVEAVFNEHMATGFFMASATVTDPATQEKQRVQIREFDPEAEQIHLTPALAGG